MGLTTKYMPRKVRDFAGLTKAKALMGKLIAAPRQSAWLFVGGPGTGKSSMALAVANEIGAQIHHVPSSKCDKAMVEQLVYDCNFIPMSGSGFHVCVIEEADLMTPAAQNAFLSVLDGSGHFPPDTVFIFTCNSMAKLEERFISRCRVIEFSGLADSGELGEYLYEIWFNEAPAWATSPLMHKIFSESKGNVRAALMAIEDELDMVPAVKGKTA